MPHYFLIHELDLNQMYLVEATTKLDAIREVDRHTGDCGLSLKCVVDCATPSGIMTQFGNYQSDSYWYLWFKDIEEGKPRLHNVTKMITG